jgi:spore coat protein CotF
MDNQQFKTQLTEKEMLSDALTSQKFVTDSYNTFSNECANPEVRNTFMNILNDEHRIQFQVFDEMSKRGWYQVSNAEQTKINQVKQQFSQGMSN